MIYLIDLPNLDLPNLLIKRVFFFVLFKNFIRLLQPS